MSRVSFHEAALPQPWQILGLKLKPFCLGHYLHMNRMGVGFVSAETVTATLADLVLAVLICSMTYEEFAEFLERKDWAEEVRQWGIKCGSFNLADKVELMNRYIQDGSRQPVVIFEGPTGGSGANWSLILKVALLNLGYSKTEALNLPLTEAFMDFYRDAETKGIVTIPDARTAELLDADLPEGAIPGQAEETPEASPV